MHSQQRNLWKTWHPSCDYFLTERNTSGSWAERSKESIQFVKSKSLQLYRIVSQCQVRSVPAALRGMVQSALPLPWYPHGVCFHISDLDEDSKKPL
jgi:hypothetical protein